MSITRVQYRERQRLTAADLDVEQDYRLGIAGRHHATQHEWGVVRGLWVHTNSRTGFTLMPGVAIDGYGREIVVAAPVEIAIDDPSDYRYMLLYYCEDPEQVPPGRVCKENPAPRIHARHALELADVYALPAETTDDFARALAAGTLQGLPLWPVSIAKIGNRGSTAAQTNAQVDYAQTRYVRHRAAMVRSPTGRSLLQIGLSNLQDIYEVLLSTMTTGGGLTRRLGIDRDGIIHAWRPVVIAGTQAIGEVAFGEQETLRVNANMPAGLFRRIRVTGEIDISACTLSASLLDIGDPHASLSSAGLRHKSFNKKTLSLDLNMSAARILSFQRLKDENPIPLSAPFDPQPAAKELRKSIKGRTKGQFVVELNPAGGMLSIHKLDRFDAVIDKNCGDVDRVRADTGEPGTPVIQFVPALKIEADPLMREIHAVVTSKPTDLVPATELRISGGAEDESDTSPRVTVGAWVNMNKTTFAPVLRMDGSRRLEVRRPATSTDDEPLLQVMKTAYLPPIGKKDPFFPDLLVLARMSGLCQAGRLTPAANAALKFQSQPPNKIARGGDLVYSLKITTWAGVVFKRCFELIVSDTGVGELIFRSMDEISAAKIAPPFLFQITSKKVVHPATILRVLVVMLLNNGTADTVAVSKSATIQVTD